MELPGQLAPKERKVPLVSQEQLERLERLDLLVPKVLLGLRDLLALKVSLERQGLKANKEYKVLKAILELRDLQAQLDSLDQLAKLVRQELRARQVPSV